MVRNEDTLMKEREKRHELFTEKGKINHSKGEIDLGNVSPFLTRNRATTSPSHDLVIFKKRFQSFLVLISPNF